MARLREFEFKVEQELIRAGVLDAPKSSSAAIESLSDSLSGPLWISASGGLDSFALLHCMKAISARHRLDLGLLHVHHGRANTDEGTRFRDEAARLVERWAQVYSLPFRLFSPSSASAEHHPKSQSEADLRDFRRWAYQQIRDEFPTRALALGHHRDDLFETRLIRLLRGTGPMGLIGMELWDPETRVLRPFLSFNRKAIAAYGQDLVADSNDSLTWLEDPSNRDPSYLRNRVRARLVPLFEELRAGGGESFCRSIELIANELNENEGQFNNVTESNVGSEDLTSGLNRKRLMSLTPPQRAKCLAGYLRKSNVANFTKNQILEVVKRIDSPRKSLRFEVAGRRWIVDSRVRILD